MQVVREPENDQIYQAEVDARYGGLEIHSAEGSKPCGDGWVHEAVELLIAKYADDTRHVTGEKRLGVGEDSSFYNRRSAGSPTS